MALKVLRAGILTTVQDLGRWGYQRFGVPVGGAMDEFSHRLSNVLVGNDEHAATLEMTLVGPGFTINADTLLAVCGADFEARVTGESLPKARPVVVRAGSALDFGPCRRGCRAYLAVAGGFEIDPVLGSRSTFLRGGFGGWQGRALRRGDLLPTGAAIPGLYPSLYRRLRETRAPMAYPSWAAAERVEALMPGPHRMRFVRGRHWGRFPDAARETFLSSEYRIGSNSDRQAYRLMGPLMIPEAAFDVVSAGVTFGTIQVPPDGEPIVLMSSRQTTGGYPRLGEVIGADLPLLAQMPAGARVRFQAVELKEAQTLLLERERELSRMREALRMRAHA